MDRGYDFVALTDHNTVSALSQFRQLAGETIATIPGMELTTFNGHALALGREDIVEWRVREGSTMSGLARSLQAAGSLYVIAHPRKEGHPFCTGWPMGIFRHASGPGAACRGVERTLVRPVP